MDNSVWICILLQFAIGHMDARAAHTRRTLVQGPQRTGPGALAKQTISTEISLLVQVVIVYCCCCCCSSLRMVCRLVLCTVRRPLRFLAQHRRIFVCAVRGQCEWFGLIRALFMRMCGIFLHFYCGNVATRCLHLLCFYWRNHFFPAVAMLFVSFAERDCDEIWTLCFGSWTVPFFSNIVVVFRRNVCLCVCMCFLLFVAHLCPFGSVDAFFPVRLLIYAPVHWLGTAFWS